MSATTEARPAKATKAKGGGGEEKAPRQAGEKIALLKGPAGSVLKALQRVSGAVGRNRGLAIFGHVLLQKDGTSLSVTAVDGEKQMRTVTEFGGSPGGGAATVDLRKMIEILRTLDPMAVVTLTTDGVRSQLTVGKSKFVIQSLDTAEFPLMREAAYDDGVKVKQGLLLGMMEQVAYSMASGDIRYYLNGMLLETRDGAVFVVGTDGHRLAMTEAQVDGKTPPRQIIIPRGTIGEMLKLLADTDDEVEIRLGGTQAQVTVGPTVLISQLIEGKFPDYRRVIPAQVQMKSVTMEREQLLAALRRANLMTTDKFKGATLTFRKDTLEVSVTSPDQESVKEEIGIDYDGPEVSIGLNVVYMLEAIENVANDLVTIGLKSSSESVLITNPKNPNFRGVLMPMRI